MSGRKCECGGDIHFTVAAAGMGCFGRCNKCTRLHLY